MKTGYELSLVDFRRLLSDAGDRQHVAPLLQRWFGYGVEPREKGFAIRQEDGAEVEAERVHERIQANREWQYDLYQTAMTLWR